MPSSFLPSEGTPVWDVILQQPGATTTSSTPCSEEIPAPLERGATDPPSRPVWSHLAAWNWGVVTPQHHVCASLAVPSCSQL